MSYMELKLHLDGKNPLYLRVPTLWDDTEKQWIGFIQLPKSKKIISGNGKTDFDLQNSFNVSMNQVFNSELADEAFNEFKALEFWERGDVK